MCRVGHIRELDNRLEGQWAKCSLSYRLYRTRDYGAGWVADVLPIRFLLPCMNVLENPGNVVIEAGCIGISHSVDFRDDRIGVSCFHCRH